MNSIFMSSAAQIIFALIPIVGITFASVLIFFALLWHHHEIKLRIKNGTYTPKSFNYNTFTLLLGLLLTGVGIVLCVLFILLDGISWTLAGGLIPFITGIMLLLFYKLTEKKEN